MIIKEFAKDVSPREIFVYTCQRISEPLSELEFKYRKSKNDIFKQYGDLTFTISFQPSIKFNATTFSVFISVDSKVFKKYCNDKYPNDTATGNIIHTTLARITKLDNEWPHYHISTALERERCIKEINLQIQDYALPFFERFKDMQQLALDVKEHGFLPHRKKQHLILNQEQIKKFIECFEEKETQL